MNLTALLPEGVPLSPKGERHPFSLSCPHAPLRLPAAPHRHRHRRPTDPATTPNNLPRLPTPQPPIRHMRRVPLLPASQNTHPRRTMPDQPVGQSPPLTSSPTVKVERLRRGAPGHKKAGGTVRTLMSARRHPARHANTTNGKPRLQFRAAAAVSSVSPCRPLPTNPSLCGRVSLRADSRVPRNVSTVC